MCLALSRCARSFCLVLCVALLSFSGVVNGQDWAELGKVLNERLDLPESINSPDSSSEGSFSTELSSISNDRQGSVGTELGAMEIGGIRRGERVYVEYNGELFPLKGWVQAPERQPLSPREKALLEIALVEEDRLLQEVNEEVRRAGGMNADSVQPKLAAFNAHRRKRRDEFAGLNTVKELSANIELGRLVMEPTRVEELGIPRNQREGSFREGALAPLTSVSNTDSPLVNTNVHRSDTTLFERNGNFYKPPQFLLPAPRDPNDLFSKSVTRSSQGRRLGQTEVAISNIDSRLTAGRELSTGFLSNAFNLNDIYTSFRATPSFGTFYDTRTPGAKFAIEKLPTTRLDTDGQSDFIGGTFKEFELPTTLLVDTQVANARLAGRENQVQVHFEATNHLVNDQFDVKHAYARVWTNTKTTIGAGKTYSLFGNNGIAPASIIQGTALIGSGELAENNRAQFRFQKNYAADQRNFAWGVAVEDPIQDDFQVDDTIATKLQRWPTLTGNLTFTGENPNNVIQLGTMFRNVGVQDNATDVEYFDSGWGFSAFGSRVFRDCPQSTGLLFAGFSGGEGVGQYIRGVSHSAVFSAGDILMLQSMGAYVGGQRRWINDRGWELAGNVVYGYAALEAPGGGIVANDTNNQLHHAWANLFLKTSDQLSYGVEWQLGRRETLASGSGENHRIFFGMQITTAKPAKPKASEIFTRKGQVQMREGAVLSEADLYNMREYQQSFAYRQGL